METLKILVIDDDPMTCSLLETVLGMENFQTVSTSHIKNEDVLALLNQENPQLIILDYHLGGEETIADVKVIRADETWHTLPILMTSGIDYKQKCLDAGANGFVLKPFDWREIVDHVVKIRNDIIQQEV
ncbi:MAG TPA: response regulator [Anaerolineae bacterium]|nr:response regulator [Anaerolineae bacterium]MCB9102932.1 response regulator [Anaerolineales bacterium]HRV92110.1 response regulator [Anaerolineae bacterium]